MKEEQRRMLKLYKSVQEETEISQPNCVFVFRRMKKVRRKRERQAEMIRYQPRCRRDTIMDITAFVVWSPPLEGLYGLIVVLKGVLI